MDVAGRRTLAVLSFALVVVMLGYGIVVPIFPFYIEALGGSGADLGLLVGLSALMELICAPVWGGLSDRLGRKRVLSVGIFGYGLSLLLMGLADRMWMLIGARALSGVLTAATMPTAMAYVSDSTDEASRGGGIGILGSASGLGIILGPGVGGWLGVASLSLPFFVGAGLSFVALFLTLVLLPEADRPGAQATRNGTARSLGPVRWLGHVLSGAAAFPLFLLFLVSVGLAHFKPVFGLYAAQKFGYGPGRVGRSSCSSSRSAPWDRDSSSRTVLTMRWGEAATIKASTIAGAVGYLILLAAYDYPTVLLATGLFILSNTVLRPALLSLISKRTVQAQGVMMGLGNTAMSLGRVIGPIWAGFAFDLNLSYPYLSGAAVLVLSFLASMIGLRAKSVELFGKGF